MLTLAAASAVLACGPPGCRPEPVNHLGRGFKVVALLGHPQRGLEVPRCSLGLAQRDEGMHDDAEVEAHREACIRLLGRLVRHRQRTSDLIYEAYAVDIGGSG